MSIKRFVAKTGNTINDVQEFDTSAIVAGITCAEAYAVFVSSNPNSSCEIIDWTPLSEAEISKLNELDSGH